MLEVKNIVGIHTRDPKLVGTLYLTDDGDLTKDLKKARRVPGSRLYKALQEVKQFSRDFFTQEVVD